MEKTKNKLLKYLPLFLIVIAVLIVLSLYRKYSAGNTNQVGSPTPQVSPAASPSASAKPTSSPQVISGTGTLFASFTTNTGGPGNNKMPYANMKISIYSPTKKGVILAAKTDQNGKISVTLNAGSYYMTAPEDTNFKRIDFTVIAKQITYIVKNIPSPKN